MTPAKPAEEDLFLHVLFTDGAQEVELVRDADKVGVKVGSDQVLFSGKQGGELSVGGERRELPQRVVKGSWE